MRDVAHVRWSVPEANLTETDWGVLEVSYTDEDEETFIFDLPTQVDRLEREFEAAVLKEDVLTYAWEDRSASEGAKPSVEWRLERIDVTTEEAYAFPYPITFVLLEFWVKNTGNVPVGCPFFAIIETESGHRGETDRIPVGGEGCGLAPGEEGTTTYDALINAVHLGGGQVAPEIDVGDLAIAIRYNAGDDSPWITYVTSADAGG